MTASAVRSWLATTLAPIGLPVYPEPLVVLPSADYITFTRFPRRSAPLTFGGVGSLRENVYTPSLLIVLINPANNASPQAVLDAYVEQVCEVLGKVATPATITDPLTAETSQLVLVTDITTDPSPLNTLSATVVVPTLTEFATEAA